MEQQRANVSKAKLEDGEYWSLNLRGVRFYLSLVVMVLTIVGISWGAVKTTGRHVFQEELQRFHTEAVPLLDAKIKIAVEQHRVEAQLQDQVEYQKLERRLIAIEGKLEAEHDRIVGMERMIERLYNARFNGG